MCAADAHNVQQVIAFVPVAGATFDAAIGLLLQHGTTSPLRTLDALQLASAQAAGTPEPTFVTAEAQLITVAAEIFAHVMNPEATSVS